LGLGGIVAPAAGERCSYPEQEWSSTGIGNRCQSYRITASGAERVIPVLGIRKIDVEIPELRQISEVALPIGKARSACHSDGINPSGSAPT